MIVLFAAVMLMACWDVPFRAICIFVEEGAFWATRVLVGWIMFPFSTHAFAECSKLWSSRTLPSEHDYYRMVLLQIPQNTS
jgi:hypothetical protein